MSLSARLWLSALLALAVLPAALPARAQTPLPAILVRDSTFGDWSNRSTNLHMGIARQGWAYGHFGSVVHPNGLLYAASACRVIGTNQRASALMRFLPDGRVDSTFGSSFGCAFVRPTPTAQGVFRRLLVQPDGKLVALGDGMITGQAPLLVARFHPDGTLDPTFGANGHVLSTPTSGSGWPSGGAWVLPGGSIQIQALDRMFWLSAGGQVDSVVLRPWARGLTGANQVNVLGAMTRLRDGRYVIIGQTNTATNDPVLMRLSEAGVRDAAFGARPNGLVPIPGPFQSGIAQGAGWEPGIVEDAQGRLYLYSSTAGSGDARGAVVLRYTRDGVLDATFGTGGRMLYKPTNTVAGARALLPLADGRVLVGGFVRWTTSLGAAPYRSGITYPLFLMLRPDGSLDPAFGAEGVASDADLTHATVGSVHGDAQGRLTASMRYNPDANGDPSDPSFSGMPLLVARYRTTVVTPTAAAPEVRARERTEATLAISPNPARGPAVVTVTLAAPGSARVAVYDALGRTVALLHDGPLGAGAHRLTWADAAPPGLYAVRLTTSVGTRSETLVRLR